jgi:hypothetical protein
MYVLEHVKLLVRLRRAYLFLEISLLRNTYFQTDVLKASVSFLSKARVDINSVAR